MIERKLISAIFIFILLEAVFSASLQYRKKFESFKFAETLNFPALKPDLFPESHGEKVSSADTAVPSEFPTAFEFFSAAPSEFPTASGSFSGSTNVPSEYPTEAISWAPTIDDSLPSFIPSISPTVSPSEVPSTPPTEVPTVFPTELPSVTPTNAPTAAPSTFPTVSPTASPTLSPTKRSGSPTNAPSTVPPSASPSLASAFPLVLPTSQPSSSPTGLPSAQPSSTPSSDPTTELSSTPTRAPFRQVANEPTASPLSVPSVAPTVSPSNSPTVSPTVEPSIAPSVSPTQVPSVAPSIMPSVYPTDVPNHHPTLAPTVAPTAPPTAVPSIAPTVSPTAADQTAQPTSSPTKDVSYSYLLLNATMAVSAFQERHRLDISFVEYVLEGASSLGYSSDPFLNTTRLIQNSDPMNTPVAVRLFGAGSFSDRPEDYHFANSSFECADTAVVSLLWTALLNDQPVYVACSGVSWSYQRCNRGKSRLCANCSDPCTKQSSYASPVVPFFPVDGLIYRGGYGVVLGITTAPKKQLWPSWSQQVFAELYSVGVTFNLSAPGVIFCNAFLPSAADIPTPLSITQSNSNYGTATATGTQLNGTVHIGGLTPQTAYKVLCYTQALQYQPNLNSRSTIAATLLQASSVTTACCEKSTITVSAVSRMVVNSTASVAVALAYLPRSDVTIVPQLIYSGVETCGGLLVESADVADDDLDAQMFGSSTASTVVPPYLTFTSASRTLSSSFYVVSRYAGCYEMSFVLSGTDQDDYSVDVVANNVASNASSFYVYAQSISAPVSVAATGLSFIGVGVQLQLDFSTETDSGSSLGLSKAASFSCSLVLDFPAAAESNCYFSTPSALVITPPQSGDNLPVPGDVFTVLGNKIASRCEDGCVAAFVPVTSIAVSTAFPVTPSAIISAPAQIGIGANFSLDISGSTGNAGRPWTVLSWSAIYNSSYEAASEITTFMNNGTLRWVNCRPGSASCNTLPSTLLDKVGFYSFTLTLMNFAGHHAISTATMQVINFHDVPEVSLMGASIASVYANVTTTIRALISVGGTAGAPLSTSWVVYRDDVIDPTVLSTSVDLRTFSVPAFTLQCGHEYRFGVTAFSGSAYSYAELSKFVLPADVVPALSGASEFSVSVDNPLTFDASSSIDTATGQPTGLSFEWSCLQLSPLANDGCDAFNSFVDSYVQNQPKFTIVSLRDVWKRAATYSVSVLVTSSSGISKAATQVISTLPASEFAVPNITVTAPATKIDNTLGYTINALISSCATFVAQWQIESVNSTVSTKTFISGGNQLFPAVIPSNSLMPGGVYVFRLTTFGGAINSASMLSHSSVVVEVNQPPINGFVAVDPSSGDMRTQFTIYASNWQDVDLPLYYTFYQQVAGQQDSILRQKMQVHYALSVLVPGSPDADYNVSVVGNVADYYGCSTSLSAVAVVENIQLSASEATSALLAASALALTQLSPEYVLPYVNLGIHVSNASNCAAFPSPDCEELLLACLGGLTSSVTLFNSGLNIVQGLSTYLRVLTSTSSVVSADPAWVPSAVQLFSYLQQKILSSGFLKCNGAQFYANMLEVIDRLLSVDQYDGDTTLPEQRALISANYTGSAVREQMSSSLSQLSSQFFHDLAFGSALNLTHPLYSIQMQKGWVDSQLDWTQFGMHLNHTLFAQNATTGFGFLVVDQLSSDPSCNGTAASEALHCAASNHSLYLELHLAGSASSNVVDISYPISESDAALVVQDAVSNQAPVEYSAICYVGENSYIDANCSTADTNGAPYVFSRFYCGDVTSDVEVRFVCPLEKHQFACVQSNEIIYAEAGSVDPEAGAVQCNYPLSFSKASSTNNVFLQSADASFSSSNVMKFSGSFSGALMQNLVSDPVISMVEIGGGGDSSAGKAAFNYITVVVVGVIFVIGSLLLLSRIKHFTSANTHVDRQLIHEACAEIVKKPQGDDFTLADAALYDSKHHRKRRHKHRFLHQHDAEETKHESCHSFEEKDQEAAWRLPTSTASSQSVYSAVGRNALMSNSNNCIEFVEGDDFSINSANTWAIGDDIESNRIGEPVVVAQQVDL